MFHVVAISHVTLLHVPSISPAPGNCLRHGLCSSSPAPVDMDPQRHPQPLWCAPVTWSILRRGCPSCCTLWKKWYVLKLLPGHSCHISALQNSPRNPRRHSGNSFWSSSRTSLSSSSLPLPPFRSSLLCSKTPQMRLLQAHSWSLLLSFLFLWQMQRLVSCKSQAQKKQSTSVLCFFTLISNLINICRLSKNTLQTKQRSFVTARPHVYMPPSSSRVTSSLSLSVTRSLQTLGSSPFLQAASV